MATPFQTQKSFTVASKSKDKKLIGADAVMIIKGYEDMSFLIKTNSLPMLKNDETIEYNTIHGAKTSESGKIQTLNELPVTFMENQSTYVKDTIETIVTEDKNDELEIEFYVGRDVENMKLWGTLQYASIVLGDFPEADTEATTTPMTITATIKGHYFPPAKEVRVNLKSTLGIK
jgi:hypothetical protein